MATDNEDIDVSTPGFLKRVVVAWSHVVLLAAVVWGIANFMGWTPLAGFGMWILLGIGLIVARSGE